MVRHIVEAGTAVERELRSHGWGDVLETMLQRYGSFRGHMVADVTAAPFKDVADAFDALVAVGSHEAVEDSFEDLAAVAEVLSCAADRLYIAARAEMRRRESERSDD